jgi:hypothetical protein
LSVSLRSVNVARDFEAASVVFMTSLTPRRARS